MNSLKDPINIDFIDSLIELGFTDDCQSCGYKYNKKDGWLGCSVHHPDVIFQNKEYLIMISLQGILTIDSADEDIIQLFRNRAVRYIAIYKKPFINKNQDCIYRTFTGILPDLSLLYKN